MIRLLRTLDALWARHEQRRAPRVLDIDHLLARRAREGISPDRTRRLT